MCYWAIQVLRLLICIEKDVNDIQKDFEERQLKRLDKKHGFKVK